MVDHTGAADKLGAIGARLRSVELAVDQVLLRGEQDVRSATIARESSSRC